MVKIEKYDVGVFKRRKKQKWAKIQINNIDVWAQIKIAI